MKTKQEKIKSWLIEQAKGAKRVEVIYNFSHHYTSDIDYLLTRDDIISGINKDGVLIPLPDFQDDQPQPKDKALQEYVGKLYICNDATELKAWEEINARLKEIELKLSL